MMLNHAFGGTLFSIRTQPGDIIHPHWKHMKKTIFETRHRSWESKDTGKKWFAKQEGHMNPQAGSTLTRILLCCAEVPLTSHGDAAKRDDPRKQKATQIAHGGHFGGFWQPWTPMCMCKHVLCGSGSYKQRTEKSHQWKVTGRFFPTMAQPVSTKKLKRHHDVSRQATAPWRSVAPWIENKVWSPSPCRNPGHQRPSQFLISNQWTNND